MANFIVRLAKPGDCEQIADLIKELAVYEKMEEQVKITADVLRTDGFGEEKFYHCFVAELKDKPLLVGYALYYYSYSTWEGRSIYMEDLYVKPEFRGKGIGTQLWKSVTKVGIEKQCSRLDFIVLNWNVNSIEYYKQKGAFDLTGTEKWHLFRMKESEMKAFIAP
ncbi:SAT [Mytilus edulis]|uniref:SpeG n=1 Tax=Mytilus edulis TaxID=6550 RepID=A0A8S3PS01_MYTED|nr:SAT [Mytilus edulis]